VLGYELYTAFIAGIAVLPTPAAKWTDLKNGTEYTVGERTYKWSGFTNAEKVSPIAYYVYCEYLNTQAVNVSGVGTTVNQQQNSTAVSPAQKIFSAWHEMNELNYSLWHFLGNNTDTYTEYDRSLVADFGSRNSFGI